MNKYIFLLLAFILSVSIVNATLTPTPYNTLCHQETANQSFVTDGSCGLIYSGIYQFTGFGGAIDAGFFNINYTKPSSVNGTIWRAKIGTLGDLNYSVPSQCYNAYQNTIAFRIISTNDGMPGNITSIGQCYNSTSWVNITAQSINYSATLISGTPNTINAYDGDYNTETGWMNSDGQWQTGLNTLESRVFEESIYWNITSIIENSVNYTAFISESTSTDFVLNITYDTNIYSSATATLYYNTTGYSSTKIGSGSNVRYTNTLTTPSVSANGNISFYWTLQMYNGTGFEYYNTSTYNQTIINLALDDCTTGTVKLFNFTLYDEDNLTRLTNISYNNSFQSEVYINNVLSYNTSKTKWNEFRICANTNITGNNSLDLTLRYDADGSSTTYVEEYYNIQDFDLNAYTTNNNISLYDLLATRSEECLFNVKDRFYLALSNALIQIDRQYLSDGSFKTVEIPKTDSLGQSIGHLVLNDEIYTIYVKKNGEILATYQNVRAIKPTGSDCIINLNVQGTSINPDDFINEGDISYFRSYNPSTRTYSVTYIIPSATSRTVNLTGWLYNAYQNESICSQSLTATSGTLNCIVPSAYENSTVLITFYDYGSEVYTESFVVNYERSGTLGKFRYILAAFLLPMFALMGISSPLLALVLFVIGFIIAISVFLIDTEGLLGTGSILVWVIIGAGILAWRINKGGQKNG